MNSRVVAGLTAGLLQASNIVALVMFASASAFAQTAAPPAATAAGPVVKVGVTVFADHTTTIEPTAVDGGGHTYKPDSFNIARSYFNIAGTLNPVLSFRVTADVSRETNTASALAGSYVARLKFAYGQVTLDKWSGRFTQTWLRLGSMPTPFVEGREAIYRYRFQGMMMPEREGLIVSADVGVGFHSNLPSGRGDVQFSVLNGEGYQKAEANNQKAYQSRISLRPAPDSAPEWARGVRLHAFYDHDQYMADADKTRLIAGATFEHPHLNAGGDIVRSTDQLTPTSAAVDGRGWWVFATPFFKTKGKGPEALIRLDRWTPDRLKSEERRRTILGASWWWTPAGAGSSVALLLDFEQLTVARQITLQPRQRRLTLHALLTF